MTQFPALLGSRPLARPPAGDPLWDGVGRDQDKWVFPDGIQADRLDAQIAIQPGYIWTNRDATDGLSEYPPGLSVGILDTATGWPVDDGWVETWRTIDGAGNYQARQVCYDQAGALVYHRYSSDGADWDSWQLVTPYTGYVEDATAYEIVDAATWETAKTLTLSPFPDERFDARVSARAQGWMYDPSAGYTGRIRVGISRDGGTTWKNGMQAVDGPWTSADFSAHQAFANDGGAVTGTIQVRLEVQSDQATSRIDDMHVEAHVMGNHT